MSVAVLIVGISDLECGFLRRELSQIGFNSYLAQSAEQAIDILKTRSIQILISSDNLPDNSLAEFVVRLEPWKSQLHMLLLADPQDKSLRHWIYAQGIALLSRQPKQLRTELRQLRARFIQPLALRDFHFNQVKLFDLLQILALSQRSLQLYITEPQNSNEGLLYLSKGQVKHALYGQHQGAEALHAMLHMQSAYFTEIHELSSDCYTLQSRVQSQMRQHSMRQAQWQAQNQHGLKGSLNNLHLLDVLQILSSSQRSQVIEVLDIQQNEKGSIVLKQGLLEHAYFHHLKGLAAFQHILNIGLGQFHFHDYTQPETQTLGQSFTQCLLALVKAQSHSPCAVA